MQKLTQAGILFLYTHSFLFMWLHWLLVAAYGSSPPTRDKTWGDRGGGIAQPQQEGNRTHLQTQGGGQSPPEADKAAPVDVAVLISQADLPGPLQGVPRGPDDAGLWDETAHWVRGG